MKYVIDTNILIHIVRNSSTWEYVDMTFEPFEFPKNETYVSFASVAEILALSLKLGWQDKKISRLSEFLSKLEIISVSGEVEDKLMQNYALIDAYSQGKLKIYLYLQLCQQEIWVKMIFGLLQLRVQ